MAHSALKAPFYEHIRRTDADDRPRRREEGRGADSNGYPFWLAKCLYWADGELHCDDCAGRQWAEGVNVEALGNRLGCEGRCRQSSEGP